MPKLVEAVVRDSPFYPYTVPNTYLDLDLPALSSEASERIGGLIVHTPTNYSEILSTTTVPVFVKDETRQPGGGFKIRGALNTLSIEAAAGETSFVTVSGGSFAVAIAIAAEHLDVEVDTFVPESTPQSVQNSIRSHGGNLFVAGGNFDESAAHARQHSKDKDRKFTHPFAEPTTIAGQGTIGRELIEDQPDMTILVLPIGGGSILPGVASVVRQAMPHVRIIGAQVARNTAYSDSLVDGRRRQLQDVDTRFGGLAVSKTHPLNLGLIARLVDQVVIVDSRVAYETKHLLANSDDHDVRIQVSPTGVVAVAAAGVIAKGIDQEGAKIVTVATGYDHNHIADRYAAAVHRRIRDVSRSIMHESG